MVDFNRLAATAKRLIEANGRDITFEQSDRTPSDATKPWRGVNQPNVAAGQATVTVKAAVVPSTGGRFGRTRTADGDLVQTHDEVALVASDSLPSGVDLKQYDRVVDDTRSWRIVGVQELRPATKSVIFEVRLAS